MPSKRLDRESWFMQLAQLYAERSTCCRASVGCIAVRDNRILGAGYVGSPPGQPHCLDVGCLIGPNGGCVRTTHAETNMIASLARHGISSDDAVMYTTHATCATCAALVVAAGFIEVVYLTPYRLTEGVELLDKCNIKVRQHHGVARVLAEADPRGEAKDPDDRGV